MSDDFSERSAREVGAAPELTDDGQVAVEGR